MLGVLFRELRLSDWLNCTSNSPADLVYVRGEEYDRC